jgi:hypothetical protein
MQSSLYTVHLVHTPDSLWTVVGILAVILKKLQTTPPSPAPNTTAAEVMW